MADNIDYETSVDFKPSITETAYQNEDTRAVNQHTSTDLPAALHDLHDFLPVSKYDDTVTPSELVSDSVSKYHAEALEFDDSEGNTRFYELVNGAETVFTEENNLRFERKEEITNLAEDEEFVYLAAAQVSSVECTAEAEETKPFLDVQTDVVNEFGLETFFYDELHKFSQKLLKFEEYQFLEELKAENQVLNFNDLEMVDDTALSESVPVYTSENGCSKTNELVSFAEIAEEYGKNDVKQGSVGKKEKRSRGKKRGGKKGLEMNDIAVTQPIKTFESGSKKLYSRKEMESLRFVNVTEQKKKWYEVYCALGPVVAKEYDALSSYVNEKKIRLNYDTSAPPRDGCSQDVDYESKDTRDNEKENGNCVTPHHDHGVGGDSDGDGYYDSMHRPAFYVEGEPNFDSGPPEDGLEYLRRVRWEAARIPNVKVVKPDKTKLVKEQTVYMPIIPDIAKCREHLLPPKQWEDVFLADFEALRESLLRLEESIPETFVDGNLGDYPTLSAILSLDSVTRVSMLRRRIKSVEAVTSLSKSDCVWLFALCAAVDTPFDADTSASVRSLLRKCASLRAEKSEVGDEVAMLNILVAISGLYFGQAEK